MKQQIVTTGVVLARTDFNEADRILTILTPDHGKVRVIAKGVRRLKSKLAGGIELFSISELTLLPGRSEIMTLVSSRLRHHFGTIVTDIQRTMFAYEVLKTLHRRTEDAAGREYYDVLVAVLAGLDDRAVAQSLTELWLYAQLLSVGGHEPNVYTDAAGKVLADGQQYAFDFDGMCFVPMAGGPFGANHLKVLRLVLAAARPQVVANVRGIEGYVPELLRMVHLATQRLQ